MEALTPAAFDVTPLIFYGAVCALLAAFLPPRLAIWARVGIGAAVGIASAICLPLMRAVLGV
ncbi:hypothetical protein N9W17_02330 [Jannaschia sp.]|nr:hypothetical protein [Jannaschia sp.]